MTYNIGGSGAGGSFYIHRYKEGGGWLHKTEDIWLDSGGSSSSEWDGYYATKEDAVRRLELFKAGKAVTVIRIGGE